MLKKYTQDQVDDFDAKKCDAFNFFWNLLRHRLPLEVLADFDTWMEKDLIPRMSPQWKDLEKKGSYSLDFPGRHYTYHNVELAPPAGVMAHNYSW